MSEVQIPIPGFDYSRLQIDIPDTYVGEDGLTYPRKYEEVLDDAAHVVNMLRERGLAPSAAPAQQTPVAQPQQPQYAPPQQAQQPAQQQAPTCPVHAPRAMKFFPQKGDWSATWKCTAKQPDGSYCDQRVAA